MKPEPVPLPGVGTGAGVDGALSLNQLEEAIAIAAGRVPVEPTRQHLRCLAGQCRALESELRRCRANLREAARLAIALGAHGSVDDDDAEVIAKKELVN